MAFLQGCVVRVRAQPSALGTALEHTRSTSQSQKKQL